MRLATFRVEQHWQAILSIAGNIHVNIVQKLLQILSWANRIQNKLTTFHLMGTGL